MTYLSKQTADAEINAAIIHSIELEDYLDFLNQSMHNDILLHIVLKTLYDANPWVHYLTQILSNIPKPIRDIIQYLINNPNKNVETFTSKFGTYTVFCKQSNLDEYRLQKIRDTLLAAMQTYPNTQNVIELFERYAEIDLEIAYQLAVHNSLCQDFSCVVSLYKVMYMAFNVDENNNETKILRLAQAFTKLLDEVREKFYDFRSRFSAFERIFNTNQSKFQDSESKKQLINNIWNTDLAELSIPELEMVIGNSVFIDYINLVETNDFILVIVHGCQNLHFIAGIKDSITDRLLLYVSQNIELETLLQNFLNAIIKANIIITDTIIAAAITKILTLNSIIIALSSSTRTKQINLPTMKVILQYVQSPSHEKLDDIVFRRK
jgi:hypothetical protein